MNVSTSVTRPLIYFAVAVIFLLVFVAFPTLAEEATPKEEKGTAVKSSTIEYQPVSRNIVSTGQLANKGTQTLSFKVAGTVEKITVEEGQSVKQGQLLAVLDKEETQAKFDQAKSLFEQSSRDLARLQSLYGKKVVPLDKVQDAETSLAVAKSNLAIAAYNLKHTEIKAPQDGVILSRMIETNELVAPHQRAFIISDSSQGWIIRTAVSDKDVVRLTHGDEVSLRFDAHPGTVFRGYISEIAAAASPTTLLFELEVSLDKTDKKLLAGFIGHMLIHPSKTESIAWLPVEAVVAAQNDTVNVFKVEQDSRVTLEKAQVAWLESGRVAIKDGPSPGSEIVTLGATFLKEGEKVSPVQ